MPAAARSLQDVITGLQKLTAEQFTHDRLDEILGGGVLRESSWLPRARWRDDKYARHQLFRTELFDLLLLCWKPGQVSPVHNHQGNAGWIRVLRGRMEETHFRAPDWCLAGVPMPGDEFDIDEDGVGHGIKLQRGDHFIRAAGPDVCSVDRQRPIHQVGNPKRHADDEPAVTLHVYSRPHDACLAFDPEKDSCWRVNLKFDSVADGASAA